MTRHVPGVSVATSSTSSSFTGWRDLYVQSAFRQTFHVTSSLEHITYQDLASASQDLSRFFQRKALFLFGQQNSPFFVGNQKKRQEIWSKKS